LGVGRAWEFDDVVTVTLEIPDSDWPGDGPKPLPEGIMPETERWTGAPLSDPGPEVDELGTPRAEARE
jgi:hypothetical protein